jgi:hypothetical protein
MDSDTHVQLVELDLPSHVPDDLDHRETHVNGVDGFLDGLGLEGQCNTFRFAELVKPITT